MLATLIAMSIAAAPAPAPILLDARCEEAAWSAATKTDAGGGVTLLAMADATYVYLCWTMPPDSLGTLDLYVEAQDGTQTDLHVSAQTGERTRGADGWPDWAGFNNHVGWYGPPVAFDGMKTTASGKTIPDFRPSAARELQIERARFGEGPWKILFQVRSLGADGAGSVDYPAGATLDHSAGWAELTLP